MKKAMLFIVALLFSVSVNAATLTLTAVAHTDTINQVIPTKASSLASQGLGDSDIYRQFTLVSDTDTQVRFELGPNVVTDVTQWSFDIDGVKTIGTTLSSNVVRSYDLAAGVAIDLWYQVVYGTDGNTSTLTVQAVPVPAALFLFAPALLGFLGLRRKATLAA